MRLIYKHIIYILFTFLSLQSLGQDEIADKVVLVYKSVLSSFKEKNKTFVVYEKSSSAVLKEFLNTTIKNNSVYFFSSMNNDTVWTPTKLDTTWSKIIHDYINVNSKEITIPKITGLDIIYINSNDLKKMNGNENDLGAFWKNFWIKFPNAVGLIYLSDIFFNINSDKAIVHYTIVSGSRSGGSVHCFLENKNGVWKLVEDYTDMVF